MAKSKQLSIFKPTEKSHGGLLRNRLNGRGARPLSTKDSMHLILRSSKATYLWSFSHGKNRKNIQEIITKFSTKYGVRIHSLANVGNHLHIHLQLTNRYTYVKWIRAITSAIAMKVTGINRWTGGNPLEKFWDYRPFSRVVRGYRAFLTVRDYLIVNKLEAIGVSRKVINPRQFIWSSA